jgi:hypothetical protein
MPGDRDGSGIEPVGGQLLPQGDDANSDQVGGGPGTRVGAAAPRFECVEATGLVAGDEGMDSSPRHLEFPGRFRLRQALVDDG